MTRVPLWDARHITSVLIRTLFAVANDRAPRMVAGGHIVEFGKVWITAQMVGDVARDTATHRTTVARWLNRRKLPAAIQRLLNLIYAGDLSEISPAWQGWKLDPRTGKLFPPNGAPPFNPGHLYAMELNYQRISALTNELRETRERLAELQASVSPRSSTLVARPGP